MKIYDVPQSKTSGFCIWSDSRIEIQNPPKELLKLEKALKTSFATKLFSSNPVWIAGKFQIGKTLSPPLQKEY